MQRQSEGVSTFTVKEPFFLKDCQVKQATQGNIYLERDKAVLIALKTRGLSGKGFPETIDLM